MHQVLKGAALLRLLALVLPLGSAMAQTGMSTPGQFSVNESGAATYTIPLIIPPGIGGVEPKLALNYNSQAGNGLLGVGWSLSGLSAIGRCPQTMAQDGKRGGVKLDNDDRYCLDGQRLMAVSGTYGADGTEYRTERESFSKIISYGIAGNGPAWFKVWTKAGQVMEYGNTADARIEAIKAAGSTATWPVGTVRQWALNKVSDTKGNYFKVSYTEDQVNGDYYPKRIDYTGNDSTNTPTAYAVVFEYEARPDIVPQYWIGALINNTLRLKDIQIYAGTAVVNNYRLSNQVSPSTARSRIKSFEQCIAPNECLPAIRMAWSDFTSLGSVRFSGSPTPYSAWHSPMTGDFNGDGLTDYMINTTNAGWYVYLSNGDGTFRHASTATPYSAWESPTPGDFNGDGLTDYMINTTNAGWYVYLSNGNGTFRHVSTATPYSAWYRPTTGDFNGDGLTDYMINTTNAGWYVYLSNGDGTFRHASTATPYSAWHSPTPGDFNGDGWTDYMINTTNAGWYVYLSNGDGTFRHAGTVSPYSAWHSPTPGDFNGDGLTDYMINTTNAGWYVYLSNGDGTFRYAGTPSPYSAWHSPTPGDFNGDGLTDYMINTTNAGWHVYLSNGDGTFRYASTPSPYSAWHSPASGDFNGDGLTDYMINTTNAGWHVYSANTGAAKTDSVNALSSDLNTISINMRSLIGAGIYTKDSGANASLYPKLDIQAPMYVVSSVSSSNGTGGTVATNYKYGGLKAEVGTGRGMLGFRWLEATQVETGMVTRTEFKQDWPYTGMVAKSQRTLAGAGNNGVLTQVETSYGCNDFVSSTGCVNGVGKRYYVYANQSTESSWDMNGAALPTIITASQYDSWGNATQVSISSSDGYSKVTSNSYSNDVGNWYLGRLNKASVTSTAP